MKRIGSGVRVEDVAASLGLSRSTVFAWVAAYREGGIEALRAKPISGRPPKLSGAQVAGAIYTLIEGADPRQYRLEFALWTRELVQQLIWTQFPDSALGGLGRPVAAHVGDVPPAAGVPRHPAGPRTGQALARDRLPGHPRGGRPGRRGDLLRRRGRDPFGRPLRHHLGPGRADPGRHLHRRPLRAEHDLRGHPERAAGVHLHRQHEREGTRIPSPSRSPPDGSTAREMRALAVVGGGILPEGEPHRPRCRHHGG